jgi:hypothetical protein
VIVIDADFQSLDLTGPFEVFAGANEVLTGNGDTDNRVWMLGRCQCRSEAALNSKGEAGVFDQFALRGVNRDVA